MFLSRSHHRSGCVRRPVMQDRPQHVHPSPGDRDDDLMVPLPFLAFARIEGRAFLAAKRCEGRLVEDPFELPVAFSRPLKPAGFPGLLEHGSQTRCRGKGISRPETRNRTCHGDEVSCQQRPHAGQDCEKREFKVSWDDIHAAFERREKEKARRDLAEVFLRDDRSNVDSWHLWRGVAQQNERRISVFIDA